MQIIRGDVGDPRVLEMLRMHRALAQAETAAGSAHALDLSGLLAPDIEFYTIWDGDALSGMGALKRLSGDHGEIKSMHTAVSARRRGVGSAMLGHLIARARSQGMARLSLETGAWDYFHPARAMYARHGFVECRPFAAYCEDPHSVFMTLDLTAR
jgi:putative acetyltransferase